MRPSLLQDYKSELLALAEEAAQAELRWHLALMIPRLRLPKREIARAAEAFRGYLNDRSSIVKTCALQALVELAHGDPTKDAEITSLLEHAARDGTPAMRARSRKLLAQLNRTRAQIRL